MQPMYMQPEAPINRPQTNGVGTAGFIVGLVGLVLGLIPFVGLFMLPVVIVGATLSAVGLHLARSQSSPCGLAIAGLTLSLIGLVVTLVWIVYVFTYQP